MSMFVLYNQQSLTPIQVGSNIDELLAFQDVLDNNFRGYYAVDSLDNYTNTLEGKSTDCVLREEVYSE